MAPIEREKTVHAIVLRRREAGDSDRRLTLLTREEGVIDVYAKGAKKAGSRLSGISEPLSASILHLATGKANWFVTQAQPITSFPQLRTDYDRLTCALVIAELYSTALPKGEFAEEAFESLLASLRFVEVHDKPLVALAWSTVRLMRLSGFMPQLDLCVVTGKKMNEAAPMVSPLSGGYVCAAVAGSHPDAYRTRAEVVLGLVKLVELGRPPVHLRYVEETVDALFRHWTGIAERRLPTFQSLVQMIVADRSL